MTTELPVGLPAFVPFTKIPRLNRLVIVTEKIDGTNAVIYVSEGGEVTAGTLDSLDGGPPLCDILDRLHQKGSVAAPGFMKPEGVVLYHNASGGLFKVTLEGDASPKGTMPSAATT